MPKRYDYYLIKDDEKDKEEVKFKRDIEIIDTLEEYWEFQKKYSLEEKQIIKTFGTVKNLENHHF